LHIARPPLHEFGNTTAYRGVLSPQAALAGEFRIKRIASRSMKRRIAALDSAGRVVGHYALERPDPS
jgi:hypothetical protein